MFSEINFCKFTCLDLILVSSNFQVMVLLQDKDYWNESESYEFQQITGPALSKTNSVIVSALTVCQERKEAHNLKKTSGHSSRVSLAHPAGQTGIHGRGF